MNDQQQTPEPPIKVNVKVDAVEPVVERIARSLESIAASLGRMAGSVGPFEVTCKNEKCGAVTMQARKTALYCSSRCKLATQKRRHRQKQKAKPAGVTLTEVRLEDENW